MTQQHHCLDIYSICEYDAKRYILVFIAALFPAKDEIVTFRIKWMDCGVIMLTEISQKVKDTEWFHSFIESE